MPPKRKPNQKTQRYARSPGAASNTGIAPNIPRQGGRVSGTRDLTQYRQFNEGNNRDRANFIRNNATTQGSPFHNLGNPGPLPTGYTYHSFTLFPTTQGGRDGTRLVRGISTSGGPTRWYETSNHYRTFYELTNWNGVR
ncbi:ribonuclease domain-containing protein [Amycolatopsis viridis]|uniref:Uncharacterized protein n=1 Tax=Amycolatopsis viridis TaxID=185678 RepID=A0ABX0SP96_9PSEU|nr:ribonuclease domain-containing protein [Amycolatopsis viridis]NIH78798.1 hypothetical protein [Amycolatopsis viridis]